MPNTVKAPSILNIPDLYGDFPAQIIWNQTDKDDIYELECTFNKRLEGEEDPRPTWEKINGSNKSWLLYNEQNPDFSWRDMAEEPEDYQLIYRGPGELVPDDNVYLYHETTIPADKKTAQFRICAVKNVSGTESKSEHLYSIVHPIRPGIAGEKNVIIDTVKDKIHDLQISFLDVDNELQNSTITVTYNPAHLQFKEGFIAEQNAIPTGRIRDIDLNTQETAPGRISIICKPDSALARRDGLVTNLRFIGLAENETQINLN